MKNLSHHLATLMITAWVGGLWAIGYLAVPVVFYTQPDRQLAGMLAGQMFSLVAYLGMVCGIIVQYFQKAKMEWHPERPNDERVQLANLGEMYFQHARLNPALLSRVPPATVSSQGPTPQPTAAAWPPFRRPVTQMTVYVSLRSAIVGTKGSQTVSVYVADQDGEPIAGATVLCTVRYPREDRVLAMPVTDTDGRSYLTFQLANPPPGYIVFVEVTATYGQAKAGGRAAFLTWW
jgi:hypothetical protein